MYHILNLIGVPSVGLFIAVFGLETLAVSVSRRLALIQTGGSAATGDER